MATQQAKPESKQNDKFEQVDLTKLSIQQLQQLKAEFETDLQIFQESIATLKMAKGKYSTSKEALDQLSPEWKEKEILVPLSGSMYVPGIVKEIDTLVIDIGTGYYVENDLPTAKDFFKRKVDYVQEQLDKIDMLGMQKSKILNAIMDVIDIKMTAMQQTSS